MFENMTREELAAEFSNQSSKARNARSRKDMEEAKANMATIRQMLDDGWDHGSMPLA